MFFVAMMAIVAGGPGKQEDCLAPLSQEEQRQDSEGRASRKKAGSLVVLEPDDDQLPSDIPFDFKPQLVIISYMRAADGSISNCVVDKPSSILKFNSASCDILRQHYRSAPVNIPSKPEKVAVNWMPRVIKSQRRLCNNNNGTVPISSDRWISSAVFAGTRIQSGSALIGLDIGANGRTEKCTILAANIGDALQRNLCNMAVKHVVALPAVDAHNNFIGAQLTLVVRFVLE